MVGQMRRDTSVGRHFLHHFCQGPFTYRGITVLYRVNLGIKLCRTERSWLLLEELNEEGNSSQSERDIVLSLDIQTSSHWTRLLHL